MCFAEKNGDIVKLYDLTSLYNEDENQENPFRHPLAHLLFRVAIKLHRKGNRSKSGLIHALLTNCLTLAPEAKPQVQPSLLFVNLTFKGVAACNKINISSYSICLLNVMP